MARKFAGNISKSLDAQTRAFRRIFKKKFPEIFLAKVIPAVRREYLRAYDRLAKAEEADFGAEVKGRDPMSLVSLRPLFEAQLDRELSAAKIDITDKSGRISINVLNRDDLGFNNLEESPEGPPTTVDILAYYILGVIGDFAFITLEQYENRGRRSSKALGRFGEGFLMPRSRYGSERWEEVTGLTFSLVRHPISGQRPYTGFDEATKAVRGILQEYCRQVSQAVTDEISSTKKVRAK